MAQQQDTQAIWQRLTDDAGMEYRVVDTSSSHGYQMSNQDSEPFTIKAIIALVFITSVTIGVVVWIRTGSTNWGLSSAMACFVPMILVALLVVSGTIVPIIREIFTAIKHRRTAITQERMHGKTMDAKASIAKSYHGVVKEQEETKRKQIASSEEQFRLQQQLDVLRIESEEARRQLVYNTSSAGTPSTFVAARPDPALTHAKEWVRSLYDHEGKPSKEKVYSKDFRIKKGMPWNHEWSGQTWAEKAKRMLTSPQGPICPLFTGETISGYGLRFPTLSKALSSLGDHSEKGFEYE